MASFSPLLRMSLFAVAALALCGCGVQDRGFLSGTVKVDGEPVGPGTITFESVNSERAGAVAHFGEDGKYEVMSAGREKGAPVGEYRVLIHGGEDVGTERAGPPPESKIPARYGSPGGAELTVSIEPGPQTHDFDLQP